MRFRKEFEIADGHSNPLALAPFDRSHIITFRVSHRQREMYIGHVRLCVHLSVCLSIAACPHYCTDLDVTLGNGGGAPWLCTIGRICNRCTDFVAMTTQHECERKMSLSACTRSMPGFSLVFHLTTSLPCTVSIILSIHFLRVSNF